jgi:Bacterial protein of unknown function (DUF839)
LTAKAIGVKGQSVTDKDGIALAAYHGGADGGACFRKADGGYYYVSNSEIGAEYDHGTFSLTAERSLMVGNLTGGAYSFEFNANHQLVGYKQVLSLTSGNCAGGATPWGTWVSCEERRGWGQCWQGEALSSSLLFSSSREDRPFLTCLFCKTSGSVGNDPSESNQGGRTVGPG